MPIIRGSPHAKVIRGKGKLIAGRGFSLAFDENPAFMLIRKSIACSFCRSRRTIQAHPRLPAKRQWRAVLTA
jgi:hypothetical protein